MRRVLQHMADLFSIIKRCFARGSVVIIATLLTLPLASCAEPMSVSDHCGHRIVALSPSLVEVVDALGLTDRLVAVSRYARFPPSIQTLPTIGGLLDPNIEGILSFNPSLVVALSESRDLAEKLDTFSVPTVIFDHRRVSGILESIQKLGVRCAVSQRADALLVKIRDRVDHVRLSALGKNHLRALVLVGNKDDALRLTNLYVSGRDGFYTDLLQILGMRNVFQGLTSAFSGVSREALIKEDPDLIFQVVSDAEISSFERRAILAQWESLPYLKAVKNKRVFLLADYVDNVPGPRFPEVLEKMSRFISGE